MRGQKHGSPGKGTTYLWIPRLTYGPGPHVASLRCVVELMPDLGSLSRQEDLCIGSSR